MSQKQAVIGIIAHVDAGKSTLAEALLLEAGVIRKAGRIDHRDAHLDTLEAERSRGITIKNKQVTFTFADTRLMLIDTPGHTDFAAEAERALTALDYAILVVGANDGLQGHGKALWRLLRRYQVPTAVFVNKADLVGDGLKERVDALLGVLGEGAVPVAGSRSAGGCKLDAWGEDGPDDPSSLFDPDNLESAAVADESALEEYLETGALAATTLRRLMSSCRLFPVFSGSALRHEGIAVLLRGLCGLVGEKAWPASFGAQVYGVSRDSRGERIAWLKVTGGSLRPRQEVLRVPAAGLADVAPEGVAVHGQAGEGLRHKVAQVRVYCGEKYELADKVPAGCVCGVTGLPDVRPGDALGAQAPVAGYACEPVMAHSVTAAGADARVLYQALQVLCEEDPMLGLGWDTESQACQLRLMGSVQLEIVRAELQDRFGLQADFGPGAIIYQETIAQAVRGCGHFEPLRHYAEVQLDLEPLPRGAGVEFGSVCGEDSLDRNWQRLILTNAMERIHKGVLVGAGLTDVRITLVAGRAHAKHTVGGDFRQATYRAIRQGLMEAREAGACVLLEPWVSFELQVPGASVGRALADLSTLAASFDAPTPAGDGVLITGRAPAGCLQDYGAKVAAYTGGQGLLLLESAGYAPCHNAEEVIANRVYDPRADLENSPDSVFCSHGAGYTVPWNEVPDQVHVDADEVACRPWIPADAGFFSNGAS